MLRRRRASSVLRDCVRQRGCWSSVASRLRTHRSLGSRSMKAASMSSSRMSVCEEANTERRQRHKDRTAWARGR
eukprot:5643710-Pleurochrysis_carterae.AAC.1